MPDAVVLAGGLGTRLRGVVTGLPKVLAPVAGRPFLAYVLDLLAVAGIGHVVLATGYLGDQVAAVVGATWRTMRISYAHEVRPLGTGGAVRQAATLAARGPLLVLNGDTYVRFDPVAFAADMEAAQARIGVALTCVADVARYGAVDTHGDRVLGFREKGGSGPGLINAGVYFLSAAAVAGLPDRDAFSLEHDVLMPAVAAGEVLAWDRTTDFIDIGVPDDYTAAQQLASGWGRPA